jgi:hypothetical protein
MDVVRDETDGDLLRGERGEGCWMEDDFAMGWGKKAIARVCANAYMMNGTLLAFEGGAYCHRLGEWLLLDDIGIVQLIGVVVFEVRGFDFLDKA